MLFHNKDNDQVTGIEGRDKPPEKSHSLSLLMTIQSENLIV